MSQLKQIQIGSVVRQDEVAANTHIIAIQQPQLVRLVKPGHFVNLSLPGRTTANLLKRPFSVYGTDKDAVLILYKVKGDVTDVMTTLRKGDEVELIGPLGNTFSIPKKKKILMVGGGIGIAPLIFLHDRIKIHNDVKILHGVRTRQESMVWGALPVQTHVDEEAGHFVCDNLDKVIRRVGAEHVVTCGPTPMMKAVALACKTAGISCDVSLEARMACGFGVCLGCVVDTKDGYKKVCNEGPVFSAESIW